MNDQDIKNMFFTIIVFAIAISATIFFIANETTKEIILGVLATFVLIYFSFKFNIILQLRDFERAVIYRFGKVNRVGGPGWTLIIPFIERPSIVTLRTQVIDIPPQQIITKDSIKLTIDAILYLSVDNKKESVINSVVKVENYKEAATLYVVAMLRDILGDFVLSDVISNTESINKQLTENLKEMAKEWGIKVSAVEIRDIQIPEEIIESMHKQKAAVQRKLAIYEEAESDKARILAVQEAADTLGENAIMYYYIKALEKMADGQSSKIIFPMELTGLLDKISSNILGNNKGKALSNREENKLEQYLPLIQGFLGQQQKNTSKPKTTGKRKPSAKKKKVPAKKTNTKKSKTKKK